MQILCLAEQIQFTEDVERALKEQNLQQLAMELNAKLEHYTTVDTSAKDPADTGGPVQACVQLLWLLICVYQIRKNWHFTVLKLKVDFKWNWRCF